VDLTLHSNGQGDQPGWRTIWLLCASHRLGRTQAISTHTASCRPSRRGAGLRTQACRGICRLRGGIQGRPTTQGSSTRQSCWPRQRAAKSKPPTSFSACSGVCPRIPLSCVPIRTRRETGHQRKAPPSQRAGVRGWTEFARPKGRQPTLDRGPAAKLLDQGRFELSAASRRAACWTGKPLALQTLVVQSTGTTRQWSSRQADRLPGERVSRGSASNSLATANRTRRRILAAFVAVLLFR